jgi:hypothetical protein
MIPKSGHRFSEKIMLEREAATFIRPIDVMKCLPFQPGPIA